MTGIDFIQDLAVVMLVAGGVGWLCHRLGLSVVVGFLAAGMLIGPYTPPFSLVTNAGSIETLAQVGLVFLMFSIGMKLSLRKLRRLGVPLIIATFATALVVYSLTRLVGPIMGLGGASATFLGAMLIVSSSAIIGKVLHETGLGHEKAGQMAMGITVLEDVVAVISLALLNSVVLIGTAGDAGVGETLGLLSAFVALAGIVGLLAVPWLLRKLNETASEELQTLVVAGLMLGLALAAQRAGYSLAMGAFLLGTIIAETPYRGSVDRVFEGARDMFSAVFFVSIGMQIDVRLLGDAWLLVLGVSAFALLARVFGATMGMLVTGVNLRDASRVGLLVTPIGEFSFIIAQLGVSAGVVPQTFQALAVGLAFVTALVAPVLSRRSGALSEKLAAKQPRWLADGIEGYQHWLVRLDRLQQRSVLWQLSRKRVTQIALEILLVTGLLVFSEQIFELVAPYLPADLLFPGATHLIFWSALGLVALMPLLAIWRNICALAMIAADFGTKDSPNASKLKPVIEAGLKVTAAVLVFFWLSAIVPFDAMGRWMPLVALGVAAVAIILLRSRLVYWHSVMEVELQSRLQTEQKFTGTTAPWLVQHSEWKLALTECVLPDLAGVRGRTLGELGLRAKFGVVVAGVERQGVMVGNPNLDTALYPRDKVLLLGDPQQTAAGKAFLSGVSAQQAAASHFDEVQMETVPLPGGSKLAGKTLAELAPTRKVGVQVAGIHRGGLRILNPGGEEKLLPGDDVLVLGRPDQISAFKVWSRATGTRKGPAAEERKAELGRG